MTPVQRIWSLARKDLAREVTKLGYPEELADLLAGELGSPKAISEIESWREKKENRDAQADYSAWLRSEERLKMGEQS